MDTMDMIDRFRGVDYVARADALEWLRSLPSGSVDLVLTDPPYNIGVADWDKIDGYVEWLVDVFKECARVCTSAGQLVFWHNDMPQIAAILEAMKRETPWSYSCHVVVPKPNFRPLSWTTAGGDLRSWFNICEYMFFFCRADAPGKAATGLEMIHSLPAFSESLRAYFNGELARAGLSMGQLIGIWQRWGQGGTGAILRHYFTPSQYELPTEEKYRQFFQGYLRTATGIGDLFPREYEALRAEYEALRAEYEALRAEYEALRPVHNNDGRHCNVMPWRSRDQIEHPCAKPVDILRRIVRVHTRPGQMVIDPFSGSGSTGVAAVAEGREFRGAEREPRYVEMSNERIRGEAAQGGQLFAEVDMSPRGDWEQVELAL